MANDITYPSLDVKLIKGLPKGKKIYRAKIDNYYRFTFEIVKDEIRLRNIGGHDITNVER